MQIQFCIQIGVLYNVVCQQTSFPLDERVGNILYCAIFTISVYVIRFSGLT